MQGGAVHHSQPPRETRPSSASSSSSISISRKRTSVTHRHRHKQPPRPRGSRYRHAHRRAGGSPSTKHKPVVMNEAGAEAVQMERINRIRTGDNCMDPIPDRDPRVHRNPAFNVPPNDNGLYCVVGVHPGRRSRNEDRHLVRYGVNPFRGFFSVFDGHGGEDAAQFCTEHLWQFVYPSVYRCEHVDDIDHVLKWAILECDKELLRMSRRRRFTSGTTLCSVLVRQNELFVANVGDSRCVLCRGGRAMPLSNDHKPDVESERERILAAGGEVYAESRPNISLTYSCCGVGPEKVAVGPQRLWPGGFGVSRTMGDIKYKDPRFNRVSNTEILVAEPEILRTTLTEEDEFLILATDGFWDAISNDEAVNLVRRKRFKIRDKDGLQDLVTDMANHAFARGSPDNITVALVMFTHFRDHWKAKPQAAIQRHRRTQSGATGHSSE